MMKVGISVLIVFCVGMLVFVLEWGLLNPAVKSRNGTSKGFLRAAHGFNTKVNPCEDFHEHACGLYASCNPIPADMGMMSEAVRIQENTQSQMKALLEANSTYKSIAINNIIKYYSSCLDEQSYAKTAANFTFAAIKSLGQWPLLEGASKWNTTNFELQNFLVKAEQNFGLTAEDLNLFKFSMGREEIDQKQRIIKLTPPDILVETEYLRNADQYKDEIRALMELRTNLLSAFAKEINLPPNPNMKEDLNAMMAFEIEIANIWKTKHGEDLEQQTASFRAVNDALKNTLNMDILNYALSTEHPVTHSFIRDMNAQIRLPIGFVERVSGLLKNTDPNILSNYLLFNVFLSFQMFLGQKFRAIQFEYDKETEGLKEMQPLWKECAKHTKSLHHAYGALYVRNHFDEESKVNITGMISNLKNAFIELVDENAWMDSETKSSAIKKAKEMIALVGYDEILLDDWKLDLYYENLTFLESENFMERYAKRKQWAKRKEAEELMMTRNSRMFSYSADTMNAMYSLESNSIHFPAGILQFPFFHLDQPQALNYGAIGATIGHELTHGFDDTGMLYNDEGNLKSRWSNDTLEQFQNRSQCFVDQYGGIEVPDTDGQHIDGHRTLGENIADNGGLREAYRAFQKSVLINGPATSLPGIQATSEQLFFYGYAFYYCSAIQPTYARTLLSVDYHSPNRFRVNVVLQNSIEFSRVFKCAPGTPMNPKEKCVLW